MKIMFVLKKINEYSTSSTSSPEVQEQKTMKEIQNLFARNSGHVLFFLVTLHIHLQE